MIFRSKLFRTHFAIAALSIFGFVFLGSWLVDLVAHNIESRRQHQPRQTAQLFVNLIEEFGRTDPVAGLKKLEKLQGGDNVVQFALLNEKGDLIYPKDTKLPANLSLPKESGHTVEIGGSPGRSPGLRIPGPPPPRAHIAKLNLDPARYLLVQFRPLPPPPGGRHLFPVTFVILALMVLLGIGVALLMIFRSLREHVHAADYVISELQKGNLKARFPVQRMDEIGEAKARFNAMADEIERLVERLRIAESSRNNLLQELAHDLRTPVASLRGILESVFDAVEMEPAVKELADLAHKEVDYMGCLVEDLLLLAQLSEPSYQPNQRPFDLAAVLEEEAESIRIRKGGAVALDLKIPESEALTNGDEHLCRRLVRNALENAFSYAKSKVEVIAAVEGGRVSVRIHDDGPGFDPAMLAKFGERRGQRMIKKSQGGRLSLGLGSVIMKSILSLHRGELRAENDPTGGALVSFSIPLN